MSTPYTPVIRDGHNDFARLVLANPNAPIVLVACCGQKLDRVAPARDIYTSDLFKKARAWAETFGACWYVLSAKYGVLPPAREIEPYDETLADKAAHELAIWNAMVRTQFAGVHRNIVVLAGARYRGWLQGVEHRAPMAGMGIGQQKAWLKAQVAAVGGQA